MGFVDGNVLLIQPQQQQQSNNNPISLETTKIPTNCDQVKTSLKTKAKSSVSIF